MINTMIMCLEIGQGVSESTAVRIEITPIDHFRPLQRGRKKTGRIS